MRRLRRIVIAFIVIVAPALGGYVLWLRESLPTIEGTVEVAGIGAAVEIIRDREGVPHIFADSTEDAYFGLGYAHAQDRLWQMEMSRRIGAGRLSELAGAATLVFDKFTRVLGVYRVAERSYAELEPESRRILDAYAGGVNAFLESRSGPLPPEFAVFGLLQVVRGGGPVRPEPWRPADSLVWIKMMAWNLGGNWFAEIQRARMATRLPAPRLAEFFPAYPDNAPRGMAEMVAAYRDLPLDRIAALAPELWTEGNGSNNWVVAGERTATGKPLLANDPHLGLTAPAIWYYAHLNAPGLNVIGATLPGVPSVILGRNDHIAWGFTNTGTDVQDLFIERISADDPASYDTPDGPRAFDVRTEVIEVAGEEPTEIVVRASRHGPIISDAFADAAELTPEGHVMAFAWTALRDDDLTLQSGHKMAAARNWNDFVNALRDFHAPQQNIVYADVYGNIGMYVPGLVPIRKTENQVMGMMPVPGWEATYDWDGFVPYEELPQVFNPPSGVIFTANHKIVEDDYPYFLTFEWESPYRARRIRELLAARPKHSVESFKALQSDVVSVMARDFLPLLLAPEPASERAAAAHAMLSSWDGTMAAEAPEPLIFAAWMRELTRLVYADELGPMFEEYWALRATFTYNVLTKQPQWCETAETEGAETCEGLIAEALERALADLDERFGSSPERWRWGEAHYALSSHRPFGRIPFLRRLFDIRLAAPGGEYTVNRGGHRIRNEDAPFAEVHGPSLRAIYTLDDLERSLFVYSTGQSGNVFAANYANLAERWRNGEYVPMVTARDAIERGQSGTLALTPR